MMSMLEDDIARLAEDIAIACYNFKDKEGLRLPIHVKPSTAAEFATRIFAERDEAAIESAVDLRSIISKATL